MYKTRGKPEDPWNKAAVKQERELVEAIQVNHIQRNGVDQRLEKYSWSPAVRQRAQQRQQNSERSQTYKDKLKRFTTANQLSKDLVEVNRHIKRESLNKDGRNLLNAIPNHNQAKGHQSPVLLRTPLGKLRSSSVQTRTCIQNMVKPYPLKRVPTKSSPVLNKLKDIEHLQEKVFKSNAFVDIGLPVDIVKELEEACLEVDMGRVQLFEINKILQAAKLKQNHMWNVVKKPEIMKYADEAKWNQSSNEMKNEEEKRAKENMAKRNEPDKKSKLLLTLNGVNQRIQEMQKRFFAKKQHRYRSLKLQNAVNANKPQISFEKKKVDDKRVIEGDLKSFYNLQPPFQNDGDFMKNLIQNRINAGDENETELVVNYAALPEVPHLNLTDTLKKCTDEATSPIFQTVPDSNSPVISIVESETKSDQDNISESSIYCKEDKKADVQLQNESKPNLQDSIFSSHFLMKEFNIIPDNLHDIAKMPSISEENMLNRMPITYPESLIQKIKKQRTVKIGLKKRDIRLCAPTVDYVLKDTLYCTGN